MSKIVDHFGHLDQYCGQFWTLWDHGGCFGTPRTPPPGYGPGLPNDIQENRKGVHLDKKKICRTLKETAVI